MRDFLKLIANATRDIGRIISGTSIHLPPMEKSPCTSIQLNCILSCYFRSVYIFSRVCKGDTLLHTVYSYSNNMQEKCKHFRHAYHRHLQKRPLKYFMKIIAVQVRFFFFSVALSINAIFSHCSSSAEWFLINNIWKWNCVFVLIDYWIISLFLTLVLCFWAMHVLSA